jgi:hypothetical protein
LDDVPETRRAKQAAEEKRKLGRLQAHPMLVYYDTRIDAQRKKTTPKNMK